MGFKVKYRGMLRELEEVVNGVAFLDGHEPASPRDIEHPDYHPTLGLTASRTASAADLDFSFGGDGGGGQYDGWVAAYLDGHKVGYLDWAVGSLVGENTLWVKMVQVEPEHRGKGYAKAMLDYVVREQFTRWGNPAPTLWADHLTDEGGAWWASAVEPAYQTTTKPRIGALNDEPEPALPRTDGGEGDEEVTEEHEDMSLISQAAAAHLQRSRTQKHAAKQALRDFTPMEQRALIDEGAGRVRARNLANLDLDGTHYDPSVLEEDPEDLGFGW